MRRAPYLFSHDKFRAVIYTEMGEARRRLYHRRALSWLEANRATAAELAFHAQAADLPELAFTYAISAGDEAMALFAVTDAIRHYKAATDWLDEVEATSAQRATLCEKYGRSLELNNDFPAAIALYQEMRQRARQANDPQLELASLVGEGSIRALPQAHSDFALAETLNQAALALLEQQERPALAAKVQHNLLNTYRWTDQIEKSLTAANASLAIAKAHNLPEQMAYTMNDLVNLLSVTGDWKKAEHYGQETMALWRKLGNRPMFIDSANNFCILLVTTGRVEEALQLATEALTMGRELENSWSQANALYIFVFAHLQRMELEQGLAAADESIQLAKAAHFVGAEIYMGSFKVLLLLAKGEVETAVQVAHNAFAAAQSSFLFLLPMAVGALLEAQLQANDAVGAAQTFAQLAYSPSNPTLNLSGIPEKAALAYLLFTKQYERVIVESDQLLVNIEPRGLTLFLPDIYCCKASALLALGQSEAAKEVAKKGIALLEKHQQRWRLAKHRSV